MECGALAQAPAVDASNVKGDPRARSLLFCAEAPAWRVRGAPMYAYVLEPPGRCACLLSLVPAHWNVWTRIDPMQTWPPSCAYKIYMCRGIIQNMHTSPRARAANFPSSLCAARLPKVRCGRRSSTSRAA